MLVLLDFKHLPGLHALDLTSEERYVLPCSAYTENLGPWLCCFEFHCRSKLTSGKQYKLPSQANERRIIWITRIRQISGSMCCKNVILIFPENLSPQHSLLRAWSNAAFLRLPFFMMLSRIKHNKNQPRGRDSCLKMGRICKINFPWQSWLWNDRVGNPFV